MDLDGGSAWAKQANSDPPADDPNPNQPYGCTYTAAPSLTAAIGAGGLSPVSGGTWSARATEVPDGPEPFRPGKVRHPSGSVPPAGLEPATHGLGNRRSIL